MELQEIGCPILARCSRGWDTMSVISPGVLSRSRFFDSPILFRESNPAALIASLFAKGKSKNGVPHILESHPRERRARMGTLYMGVQGRNQNGKAGPPAHLWRGTHPV